jgi:heme-degrading monooxygenase HmoA
VVASAQIARKGQIEEGLNMYARVTTVQVPTDQQDESIRQFREQTIPAARQQAGFQGAYLLVDRQSGKAIGITLWESEAAMRQSEQMAQQQRSQVPLQPGAAPSIERYEVAVQP